MPNRRDNGAGARRIALEMCDLCVDNQRLISDATDAILDSDKENKEVLRKLNQLARNNAEAFAVQGHIADGKSAEAEYIAVRAAANKQKAASS